MPSLVFTRPPPAWRAYAAALLSRRPARLPPRATLPPLEARLDGASAAAARLAEYRRLCGFPADGTLPITFPHVLATPLHLALLTSSGFPVRLLGVVHVANAIERRRPIPEGARLDLSCRLAGPREDERGQSFALDTEARLAGTGEVAWREVTTFLARAPRRSERRERSGVDAAPPFPEGARSEVIGAPADLGRRYAAASGDYNPIHLWPLTARPFGFSRPIAHGMWSLARVAASLEADADGPLARVEAAFKRPVLLPAEVELRSWGDGEGGIAFALVGAGGGTAHATGSAARAG